MSEMQIIKSFSKGGGYEVDLSAATANTLVAKQRRTMNHLCCSLSSDDIWRGLFFTLVCSTMNHKRTRKEIKENGENGGWVWGADVASIVLV